ncbi:MAG: DinB family protein [Mesobacillus sp.]|uniref:DinB family protein n=1 Tax=Mesobacillus sp. TaxID=2675271 RepID=UPI003C3F3442
MYELFLYNWQVRDDWFRWCEDLTDDELTKHRVGGMGSILKTLFHVIDCEQLWINQMLGNPVIERDINAICSLDKVKEFSRITKEMTNEFIKDWTVQKDTKNLEITSKNGRTFTFPYPKLLNHIISHEIHHIGQLSIWARELDKKPVNCDLLIREFH